MMRSNSKVNKSLQVHLDRLSFCEKIAQQSVCLSRHVGACLIKDGIVVSTGFNHVPKNTEDCQVCRRKISGKDLDTCKAIHAEEMCILNYLRCQNKFLFLVVLKVLVPPNLCFLKIGFWEL